MIKTVVAAALALGFAALLFLTPVPEPARENGVHGLVYHPTVRQPALLNADIPTIRRFTVTEVIDPYPPTAADFAWAISRQDIRKGLHGFAIRGWEVIFYLRGTSDGVLNYSALAIQKGAEGYYYSVKMNIDQWDTRISVSPPVVIRICANGDVASPTSGCADGSVAQPLIGP